MEDPISEKLRLHYDATFRDHGPTSQGVDWGDNQGRVARRYENMLAVIRASDEVPSLLDVGCGYGGLLQFAGERSLTLEYTGIDVSGEMIAWGKGHFGSLGRFIAGDILSGGPVGKYDYVVCNGILTQKLDVPALDMDRYAERLIRRMFGLCNKGIVFNIMTTRVNYFSNNLYYRSPVEMLAWCLAEITPHVRLDHSYPMFEYTLYLYRAPQ